MEATPFGKSDGSRRRSRYSVPKRNDPAMKRVRRRGANRRHFLVGLGASLLPFPRHAWGKPAADQVVVGRGKLEISALRFDCTPPVGVPSPTLGVNPVVRKIEGPMETRLLALRQGRLTLGWVNSDYNIWHEGRRFLARGLDIPQEQTIASATHNHSIVTLGGLRRNVRGFGKRFFRNLREAARSLEAGFEPAKLSWATAEEPSITYNRKGVRPDGSTYFMREEDRILLGDFEGANDPLASLLRFDRPDGTPLALMGHFTGHPVASYNLEEPVINPDFSGWSILDLVESFHPRRPVGFFLQGCAGDINVKGMFDGPERARAAGRRLGGTLIRASSGTRANSESALALAWGTAQVPYAPLPPPEKLRQERRDLMDFQRRTEAGDPDTLRVLGYNFSSTMKMKYRKNLARPLLRWTDWALEVQKNGTALPDSLPVPLQAIVLGDVAVVTIPCEAFSGIGKQIRRQSPFAMTIPAAYSNGYLGYIGTSRDVGDGEYMSASYRYMRRAPFARPAGDAIATKAVELLKTAKDAMG